MQFVEFSALVHARRTDMGHDRARAVEPAVIEQLCELATWAPNHRRTWPWRFAAFTGAGRDQLGAAFATDLTAQAATHGVSPDARQVAKTAIKYTRSAAVLVIATTTDGDPTTALEDRDAVAAGVQNVLLGASALGLNSYWSSPPMPTGANVNALCGFEASERIVAVIYLGWDDPSAPSPVAPLRPPVRLTLRA